jgi:hypothetical protein
VLVIEVAIDDEAAVFERIEAVLRAAGRLPRRREGAERSEPVA